MIQCGSCGHEFDGRPPRGHVLAFCPRCEEQRGAPMVPKGDELEMALEHVIAAADLLGWEHAAHRVERDGEQCVDALVIGMSGVVVGVLGGMEGE